MNFVGKWLELENIILSELTHTKKDMNSIQSLISGDEPKGTEYP